MAAVAGYMVLVMVVMTVMMVIMYLSSPARTPTMCALDLDSREEREKSKQFNMMRSGCTKSVVVCATFLISEISVCPQTTP